MITREMQTPGDLIYTLGTTGKIRAYLVEDEGTVQEISLELAELVARGAQD